MASGRKQHLSQALKDWEYWAPEGKYARRAFQRRGEQSAGCSWAVWLRPQTASCLNRYMSHRPSTECLAVCQSGWLFCSQSKYVFGKNTFIALQQDAWFLSWFIVTSEMVESFFEERQLERTLSEDIDTEGRVAMSHIRGVDSLPSLGKCFQCCSTPTIVPNGGQMVAGYLTSVHFPNVTCLCLLMTELRGLGRKLRIQSLPSAPFTCPICSQRKVIVMMSLLPHIFY